MSTVENSRLSRHCRRQSVDNSSTINTLRPLRKWNKSVHSFYTSCMSTWDWSIWRGILDKIQDFDQHWSTLISIGHWSRDGQLAKVIVVKVTCMCMFVVMEQAERLEFSVNICISVLICLWLAQKSIMFYPNICAITWIPGFNKQRSLTLTLKAGGHTLMSSCIFSLYYFVPTLTLASVRLVQADISSLVAMSG